MTAKEARQRYGPTAILGSVGLLVAILAAAGFARKEDLAAERAARIGADSMIRAEQAKVNNEIMRKLDCSLFDLPKGCRDTMAPRER